MSKSVKIKAKRKLLEIDFLSFWHYKDLLIMLIYRDFVTYYKQTILGPIWFLIQPLFYAIINSFVFGSLAGLGPSGVPNFLFYMSGPIMWQYFQETFIKTSSTFISNQETFGKVFFPRLIMPVSVLISGLLKLFIQIILLIITIIYYNLKHDTQYIQKEIVFFPIILVAIMMTSLGLGLIVSSLTTKYRDLRFFIDFSVPLLKYVTPGIATTYLIFTKTLSENFLFFIKLNPIGHLLDCFNFMFIGAGNFNISNILICLLFSLICLFFGVIVFNQVEKNFMDTV